MQATQKVTGRGTLFFSFFPLNYFSLSKNLAINKLGEIKTGIKSEKGYHSVSSILFRL
jgi:hypothetical protein